jgi:hypothetical protein
MTKRKNKRLIQSFEDALNTDPMRRFVYGLLASIEIAKRNKAIKPKRRARPPVTKCEGCRAFVVADRAIMPSRCPQCGRPAGEAVREFWLATERKSPPAAGAHTPGYRRAKKS